LTDTQAQNFIDNIIRDKLCGKYQFQIVCKNADKDLEKHISQFLLQNSYSDKITYKLHQSSPQSSKSSKTKSEQEYKIQDNSQIPQKQDFNDKEETPQKQDFNDKEETKEDTYMKKALVTHKVDMDIDTYIVWNVFYQQEYSQICNKHNVKVVLNNLRVEIMGSMEQSIQAAFSELKKFQKTHFYMTKIACESKEKAKAIQKMLLFLHITRFKDLLSIKENAYIKYYQELVLRSAVIDGYIKQERELNYIRVIAKNEEQIAQIEQVCMSMRPYTEEFRVNVDIPATELNSMLENLMISYDCLVTVQPQFHSNNSKTAETVFEITKCTKNDPELLAEAKQSIALVKQQLSNVVQSNNKKRIEFESNNPQNSMILPHIKKAEKKKNKSNSMNRTMKNHNPQNYVKVFQEKHLSTTNSYFTNNNNSQSSPPTSNHQPKQQTQVLQQNNANTQTNSASQCLINNLDHFPPLRLSTTVQELTLNSQTAIKIKKMLNATLPEQTVCQILEIHNPSLQKAFQFQLMNSCGLSQPVTKLLWWLSRPLNPKDVYTSAEGIYWKYAIFGLWGEGLYFSEDANYAFGNAYEEANGIKSLFLMTLMVTEPVQFLMPGNVCPQFSKQSVNATMCGIEQDSRVFGIPKSKTRCYPSYLVSFREK